MVGELPGSSLVQHAAPRNRAFVTSTQNWPAVHANRGDEPGGKRQHLPRHAAAAVRDRGQGEEDR